MKIENWNARRPTGLLIVFYKNIALKELFFLSQRGAQVCRLFLASYKPHTCINHRVVWNIRLEWIKLQPRRRLCFFYAYYTSGFFQPRCVWCSCL